MGRRQRLNWARATCSLNLSRSPSPSPSLPPSHPQPNRTAVDAPRSTSNIPDTPHHRTSRLSCLTKVSFPHHQRDLGISLQTNIIMLGFPRCSTKLPRPRFCGTHPLRNQAYKDQAGNAARRQYHRRRDSMAHPQRGSLVSHRTPQQGRSHENLTYEPRKGCTARSGSRAQSVLGPH